MSIYRKIVAKAYNRRACRRSRLLVIFAERGWSRPHELGLLYVCILGGATGLFLSGATSSVIMQAFPPPFHLVWFIGVMAGGIIAYGGILSNTELGLHIERAGLLALTGWLLAFPVIGLSVAGTSAINVSVFIGAFGVCNIVRAFHISVDLHELAVLTEKATQRRNDGEGPA